MGFQLFFLGVSSSVSILAIQKQANFDSENFVKLFFIILNAQYGTQEFSHLSGGCVWSVSPTSQTPIQVGMQGCSSILFGGVMTDISKSEKIPSSQMALIWRISAMIGFPSDKLFISRLLLVGLSCGMIPTHTSQLRYFLALKNIIIIIRKEYL